MVEGRWGVDEQNTFDGVGFCEQELGGVVGNDAAKGPA